MSSSAAATGDDVIDVVVPVYRGLEQTRACLRSVLASSCRTAFHVVVVEDASPEPALVDWLVELAAAGEIELLRNSKNCGFVVSVNRGMALHPERDVVLLNSDTEVSGDWLDRLLACAQSDPCIATVTPFSNNATVCSYPYEGWDGGVPGGLGLAGLDRIFARALSGRVADLPTGIGFCMFIRRECISQAGYFDAEAFGRGYGEENDFCRRLAERGWRNVLAADVFVYHRGAVSFGEERFALMREAEAALLARHPDYNDVVRTFIDADPLLALRDEVDRARVALGGDEAAHVLVERQRERAMLQHSLRAMRAAASRPATVRGVGQMWRELIETASVRLQVSTRWGPRRRRMAGWVLRGLSLLSSRPGR